MECSSDGKCEERHTTSDECYQNRKLRNAHNLHFLTFKENQQHVMIFLTQNILNFFFMKLGCIVFKLVLVFFYLHDSIAA